MVKINQLLLTLVLFLMLVFAGCSKTQQDLTQTTITDNSVQIEKEDAAKSESQVQEEKLIKLIEDGIYKENMDYQSPGGLDKVNLNMQIENNKVVSMSLEAVQTHDVSKGFIDSVNKELQTLAIGKSISEIKIPAIVSGASLTTKALNDKLEALKSN